MTTINAPLTGEQVENWRRVLVSVIGPYALLMSKEQIQAMRDKMQAKANEADQAPTAPDGGRGE